MTTSQSRFMVKDFQRLNKIGEGTYGIVFKCLHKNQKKFYALKKIRTDSADEGIPSTALREIAVLSELSHPNIVKLEETLLEDGKIYLVFEFLKGDLKNHLDTLPPGQHLQPAQIQSYMYQILQGLLFCHRRRFIHRDLKPQNLLLAENGVIKLADFGLARAFGLPVRVLTHEVVTLWYRAPEVLLGTKRYSSVIDVWSTGTIFSEMANNQPLFRGDSEIDQLFRVFRVLGTPTERTWPGVSELSEYKSRLPMWPGSKLPTVVKHLGSEKAVDLIQKMLTMDPSQRITCQEALKHPYFDDFDRSSVPAANEEFCDVDQWLKFSQHTSNISNVLRDETNMSIAVENL